MQQILGHSSIVTTTRYTRLSTTGQTNANERIDALMRQFTVDWKGVK